MSKFKVGDRVRCVERDAGISLTIDKIYEVRLVQPDGWIYVINDDGNANPYNFRRFEPVTDTPRPDPVEWLKAHLVSLGNSSSSFPVLTAQGTCVQMLRECYGIDASEKQITETRWTFFPVQP